MTQTPPPPFTKSAVGCCSIPSQGLLTADSVPHSSATPKCQLLTYNESCRFVVIHIRISIFMYPTGGILYFLIHDSNDCKISIIKLMARGHRLDRLLIVIIHGMTLTCSWTRHNTHLATLLSPAQPGSNPNGHLACQVQHAMWTFLQWGQD